MTEEKQITAEEWEQEVRVRLNEIIDNMLSVAKDCNMGTRYFYPVKEQYETHTEFDKTKLIGAELRIVFNFVEALKKESIEFI